MTNGKYHETVLTQEAVDALQVKKSGVYIDATVGTGGHALEILKRGGKVFGIDIDRKMLAYASERLSKLGDDFTLVEGNFRNIDTVAEEHGIKQVSGIIFDLGVSNIHLTSQGRGFSFQNPGALLDMRLSPDAQGVTGANLLGVLREDQLIDLFSAVMEKGEAGSLAKKIVEKRKTKPVSTVGDLLSICEGIRGKRDLNPATLPFLALRIAVNSELDNLEEALPKAFGLLASGGRLVVISFHSGEDGLVKKFLESKKGEAKALTDTPIGPSEEEIQSNPRSRSARMRILQKR